MTRTLYGATGGYGWHAAEAEMEREHNRGEHITAPQDSPMCPKCWLEGRYDD